MSLTDIAEFRSPDFAPYLPDDAQVNPGVYGAELAYWLSKTLAEIGVITSYPEYEDWGWYIEYVTDDDSEFAVHCYNVDGATDHWLLSLRRYPKKLFGRGQPPLEEAAALVRGIRAVLTRDASISELQWLYPEPALPQG